MRVMEAKGSEGGNFYLFGDLDDTSMKLEGRNLWCWKHHVYLSRIEVGRPCDYNDVFCIQLLLFPGSDASNKGDLSSEHPFHESRLILHRICRCSINGDRNTYSLNHQHNIPNLRRSKYVSKNISVIYNRARTASALEKVRSGPESTWDNESVLIGCKGEWNGNALRGI